MVIKKNQKGFTLMEMVISVAIFAILSTSVYGVFTSVMNGIVYYREKATISFLADQYMEIARNLPYADIGTVEGNPYGSLPDLPNPLSVTVRGAEYHIYYAISYVDDSADGTAVAGTDVAPKDYKQVKLYIANISTGSVSKFLTNVSPNGLEGLESGGAIYIKVFDAVGEPVSGATIHIVNTSLTPNINLSRMSGSDGTWTEVGLLASTNGYNITVTKDGYSTDQTYPITTENPDPVKPDSTVIEGQVTQVSFSIDLLSDLTFYTLNQNCYSISGVGVEVKGEKLIGTPNVLKFDKSYTSNSSGVIYLSNIEWDSYAPELTGTAYMIYGSSPIQEVSILPNTNQNFALILGPKTQNSFLVIVKDASTGNPVEGAQVVLQSSSLSTSYERTTGGSVWSQLDWSGGSGQADFEDNTMYYQDDGNVSADEIPSGLRLAKIGSDYVSSGILVSSSFDTGTTSTSYTTLNWQPTSQDSETEIKFQMAANNDNETWNFVGPDGTAGTYYTVSGTSIYGLDENQYVRYKVFLSTSNALKTPVLSSLNVNYVSGCYTPGQAMFSGLDYANDYQVTVTADGYEEQLISDLTIKGYNSHQIGLSQ